MPHSILLLISLYVLFQKARLNPTNGVGYYYLFMTVQFFMLLQGSSSYLTIIDFQAVTIIGEQILMIKQTATRYYLHIPYLNNSHLYAEDVADSSAILIISACPDAYIELARALAYPEYVFM